MLKDKEGDSRQEDCEDETGLEVWGRPCTADRMYASSALFFFLVGCVLYVFNAPFQAFSNNLQSELCIILFQNVSSSMARQNGKTTKRKKREKHNNNNHRNRIPAKTAAWVNWAIPDKQEVKTAKDKDEYQMFRNIWRGLVLDWPKRKTTKHTHTHWHDCTLQRQEMQNLGKFFFLFKNQSIDLGMFFFVFVLSVLHVCIFHQHQNRTGTVQIRHCSHHFATQSSHSVDRAGQQAEMATIEFWKPWCNVHRPYSLSFFFFNENSNNDNDDDDDDDDDDNNHKKKTKTATLCNDWIEEKQKAVPIQWRGK